MNREIWKQCKRERHWQWSVPAVGRLTDADQVSQFALFVAQKLEGRTETGFERLKDSGWVD